MTGPLPMNVWNLIMNVLSRIEWRTLFTDVVIKENIGPIIIKKSKAVTQRRRQFSLLFNRVNAYSENPNIPIVMPGIRNLLNCHLYPFIIKAKLITNPIINTYPPRIENSLYEGAAIVSFFKPARLGFLLYIKNKALIPIIGKRSTLSEVKNICSNIHRI